MGTIPLKIKKFIGMTTIAVTSFLLNCLFLCVIFIMDKADSELCNHLGTLMIFVSGLSIVISHILFNCLNRKLKLYDELDAAFILAMGTIGYIILILFLFPVLLSLNLMYELLPARELAADYIVLIIQFISVITAIICCIIDLIIFYMKRKMKAEKNN